jgi:hypothetical protein
MIKSDFSQRRELPALALLNSLHGMVGHLARTTGYCWRSRRKHPKKAAWNDTQLTLLGPAFGLYPIHSACTFTIVIYIGGID